MSVRDFQYVFEGFSNDSPFSFVSLSLFDVQSAAKTFFPHPNFVLIVDVVVVAKAARLH